MARRGGSGRVRTVSVRVTAQISDFEKKMLSAKKKMKKFGNEMEKHGKTMTKLFTVPFLAATATVAKLTQSTMEFADKMDKMSIRTGVATDRLQELQYISGQVGVQFSSIEKSMGYLTRRMNSAEKGTGDYYEAFKMLKVELKEDGTFREIGDIYSDTIKKLAGMTDETKQAMLTTKLFGTQAQQLLPLIRAGEDGIDELTKQFRSLGLGMDKDTIDKFVVLADKIDTLKYQFKTIGMTIATAFLPIITKITDFVSERIVPSFRKLSEGLGSVNKNFIAISGIFAGLLALLGPITISFGMLVKVIAALSIKVLAIPIAIAAISTALFVLVRNNENAMASLKQAWEGLKTFFIGIAKISGQIWDSIGEHVLYIINFMVNRFSTGLRIIGNVFAGFGNLLQGNWGDLWKNVTSIYEDFGRYMISGTGLIVRPVISIFDAMAKNIVDGVFGWVGKRLEEFINKAIETANSAINLLNRLPGVNIETTVGRVSFEWGAKASNFTGRIKKQIDDFIKEYGMQDTFKIGDIGDIFGFDLKEGENLISNLRKFLLDLEDAGVDAYENMTSAANDYIKALKNQTHAFANFVGIFERAERQTFSPGRILSRMRGQVRIMEQWQNNLQKLEQRGLSQQLMNELRGMGAGSASQIQALTRMSDERLAEFQSLYGQRMSIAGQEAQAQIAGQNMIDTLIESQINITITDSNIRNDEDAEKTAQKIIQKLKLAGVRI